MPARAGGQWAGILTVLVACTPVCAALAQSRVHGTIRDSTQRTPLALVEVLVEGMNLSTLSDAQGRYALTIPLGFHTIRFRRVGYHPIIRQLRLSANDSTRLDLSMLSQAQRLDSVTVVSTPPSRMWPPGLDDRMKGGMGNFITDSILRKYEHTNLSTVLESRAGGVRFTRMLGRNVAIARRGGVASLSKRMGPGVGGNCFHTIWFDGVLIFEQSNLRIDPEDPMARSELPPDLDRYAVASIEAVEVYTAAQVPMQYRGGSAGCGVILLWSRNQRR